MLPEGLSLLQTVYFFFHPLKGRGLLATLIINVSAGFKLSIDVLLPDPDSAITRILCAIFI
jgi:hypothetical protein